MENSHCYNIPYAQYIKGKTRQLYAPYTVASDRKFFWKIKMRLMKVTASCICEYPNITLDSAKEDRQLYFVRIIYNWTAISRCVSSSWHQKGIRYVTAWCNFIQTIENIVSIKKVSGDILYLRVKVWCALSKEISTKKECLKDRHYPRYDTTFSKLTKSKQISIQNYTHRCVPFLALMISCTMHLLLHYCN